MVVVAIATILAAIAIPNLKRVTASHKIIEETARVEGFLLKARDIARMRNRCVEVVAAGNTLTRTLFDTCTGVDAAFRAGTAPTTGAPIDVTTLELRSLSAGSTPTLVFLPVGAVAASSNLDWRFLSTSSTVVSLEIWPASGTVRQK